MYFIFEASSNIYNIIINRLAIIRRLTIMAKKQSTTIKEFTDEIFNLIGFMEKKSNNSLVKSLRGKVNLARRVYDAAIIEHAGEYFYKYQDKIIARDEQFFIDNDICAMENIEDKFIVEIVKAIRSLYFTLTTSEKDFLYDKIQKLLALYFEYLLSK
jgi:hypothetical protein